MIKRLTGLKYREGSTFPVMLLFGIICGIMAFGQAFGDQSTQKPLVIGVGRDLYDGPDSRTYLHGSTHTWEALTYLGEGLRASPWLAESWHSTQDGRTWFFKLRAGVLFHDGSELTASIAKASIERIASSPRYDPGGVYRHLERLESRGELELVFYLKKPSPDFPKMVAYYSSPVIHPNMFDKSGRLTGLVATGPYRVIEIKEGEHVVLESFPGHWAPKPAFRRVIFRTLLDAQTRTMALLRGEVDAVADVGAILPQQADMIRNAPGITLKQVEVVTTHYLLFNCLQAPFDSKTARQWLAGIIDRRQIVETLVAGAGKVAADPFSPLASEWAFGHLDPGLTAMPSFNGTPLIILLHSATLERWPYRDIAQIIQAQLAAGGAGAGIIIREPGGYYEDLQQGRYHLALQPNTLMTGEPDFFYSYYVASDGYRHAGCGTADMDQLIALGRHTMDPEQRLKIYQKLSLLFADRLPLLPLYHDISFYAHGSGITNFSMDHNFRPVLMEVRPSDVP